tara:strand:- start:5128 stop:5457 length:330 start_codon:yes stop_codon:yes gene_type:complete
MKTLKTFVYFLLIFYVTNILTWFIFSRNFTIKGIEKLSNSDVFVNNRLSYEMMHNSMESHVDFVDENIFSPFFNLGFALSSMWQLIPILIMFAIYIFYLIKKRKSKTKS